MFKRSKTNVFLAQNTLITLVIIFLLVVGAVLLRIFVIKESPYIHNKDKAIVDCVDLCEYTRKFEGLDPEGACLSEEIVAGWACDIVHFPKLTLVDDDIKNKCPKNNHLVEVDFSCNVVSAK
jgi:hypothetical protein